MTRALKETVKCLRLLPKALLVTLVVSTPLLAVPSLRAADQTLIVAPSMKKSGAGFVLVVSLRRG